MTSDSFLAFSIMHFHPVQGHFDPIHTHLIFTKHFELDIPGRLDHTPGYDRVAIVAMAMQPDPDRCVWFAIAFTDKLLQPDHVKSKTPTETGSENNFARGNDYPSCCFTAHSIPNTHLFKYY